MYWQTKLSYSNDIGSPASHSESQLFAKYNRKYVQMDTTNLSTFREIWF